MERTVQFGVIVEELLKYPVVNILEFGTIRHPGAYTDGMSTLLWAGIVNHVGGRLWSVDKDPAAIAACKGYLEENGEMSDRVSLVLADCNEFVDSFDGAPLHLVYLDGCGEWPTGDPEGFAKNHLTCLLAVEKLLVPGGLVAVDDIGVRGKYVLDYMDGWRGYEELSRGGVVSVHRRKG